MKLLAPLVPATNARMSVRLYSIAVVAALGGFLFGYDLSIISGAIIFITKDFHLSPIEVGFAMSSASIGCFLGPIAGGAVCDFLGRRKTLAITAVLFGLGALGTAFPRDMLTFNIFRILGGVGVGIASITSPMYIAEIAPSRKRGRLIVVNQLAIVVGSMLSIVVAYLLSFSGEWRWMLGSECLPVILFLIGLALVPESPRWLVRVGREADALAILEEIDDHEHAHTEFQNIIASKDERKSSFRELLKPGMRMALSVALMLAIFQQLSGVSTLMFYSPIIFQKAGFSATSDALFQAVVVALCNLVCTIIAFAVVDRIGRRPLLLTGTVGMAVSLFLMGLLFSKNIGGPVLVIVMLLCVGGYVISLAPVTWLIMSEIFPTGLRSRAMGIATLGLWASCFLANQTFPPVVSELERRMGNAAWIFWIFALITVAAVLFSWRFVPETKGRSLEEIAKSWSRRA